ncbi:hypothetical protein L208DRAFT_1384880 [Tricholoma matsutake]|nr:hypothetical protein L208DRAFT_1384880 [Tricholoma matsutake 945]
MSTNDLYKYITYVPSGGDTLVKGSRETIYSYPGDESMYAAVNTYLVKTTWISLMSWRNDTDVAQQYAIEYQTELSVTDGSDVTKGFSLAAAFKGMSIGFDYQQKVFQSTETTESKTLTITVTIPPRSYLVFYQRKYTFKSKMAFVLYAWSEFWNVGSWGGYVLTTKESTVEIMSEDYATMSSDLNASGSGTMSVTRASGASLAGITRKRENCTEKCKKKLVEMGL